MNVFTGIKDRESYAEHVACYVCLIKQLGDNKLLLQLHIVTIFLNLWRSVLVRQQHKIPDLLWSSFITIKYKFDIVQFDFITRSHKYLCKYSGADSYPELISIEKTNKYQIVGKYYCMNLKMYISLSCIVTWLHWKYSHILSGLHS